MSHQQAREITRIAKEMQSAGATQEAVNQFILSNLN